MHGFPKSLSGIKSLSCFQLVISVYSSSKTSLRTLLLKRLIEQIYITIGSRGLDGMNNLACSQQQLSSRKQSSKMRLSICNLSSKTRISWLQMLPEILSYNPNQNLNLLALQTQVLSLCQPQLQHLRDKRCVLLDTC